MGGGGANLRVLQSGGADFEAKIRGVNSVSDAILHDFEIICPARGCERTYVSLRTGLYLTSNHSALSSRDISIGITTIYPFAVKTLIVNIFRVFCCCCCCCCFCLFVFFLFVFFFFFVFLFCFFVVVFFFKVIYVQKFYLV